MQMVFNKLYEESDKSNTHRWKIAGLVMLALISFLLLIQITGKPLSQPEIEKRIASTPILRRHDKFCTDLPKPDGYKLLYKSFGGNSFTIAISYNYQIPMRSKDVFQFYQKLFDEKGWTYKDGRYESKNGKQFIGIHFVSAYDHEYSIYCAELQD